MFGISFTTKDLVRAVWTFIFAAVGYIAIAQPTTWASAKTVFVAAVAAGLSAVKNLILADGSTVKG